MKTLPSTISEELLTPGLPVLGQIKIGAKEPKATTSSQGNDFQRPIKLDHFRITTRTRGPDGNLEIDHAIHEIVGAEPKELRVRLPFDTREENFYAQMTYYRGNTQVRACNGEVCRMPQDETEEPCARAMGHTCPCKPYSRLSVILEAAPTFGGLHVYRTTSWEATKSMQTILGMLEKDMGSLRGLPMLMKLYLADVTFSDGKGGTRKGKAYKVGLVLRASFEEAREAMIEYHRQNRIARAEVKQIAGATVASLAEMDREEEDEIGAEFFPPESAAAAEPEKSPLAQMNREILQGTPVEEPEEEEPEDGGANRDPVKHLKAKLQGLLDEAKEKDAPVSEKNLESLQNAIRSGDRSHLEIGIDWLEKLLNPEEG